MTSMDEHTCDGKKLVEYECMKIKNKKKRPYDEWDGAYRNMNP